VEGWGGGDEFCLLLQKKVSCNEIGFELTHSAASSSALKTAYKASLRVNPCLPAGRLNKPRHLSGGVEGSRDPVRLTPLPITLHSKIALGGGQSLVEIGIRNGRAISDSALLFEN
jgi:hypothetical protein